MGPLISLPSVLLMEGSTHIPISPLGVLLHAAFEKGMFQDGTIGGSWAISTWDLFMVFLQLLMSL